MRARGARACARCWGARVRSRVNVRARGVVRVRARDAMRGARAKQQSGKEDMLFEIPLGGCGFFSPITAETLISGTLRGGR